MITKEVIGGVLHLVEKINYSNGKIVKRILDMQTGAPTGIIIVRPARPIKLAIIKQRMFNAIGNV